MDLVSCQIIVEDIGPSKGWAGDEAFRDGLHQQVGIIAPQVVKDGDAGGFGV